MSSLRRASCPPETGSATLVATVFEIDPVSNFTVIVNIFGLTQDYARDIDSNIGIFRAACMLQKQKLKKPRVMLMLHCLMFADITLQRGVRSCSLGGKDTNHEVPFSWALDCKKCHRSRCFNHILTKQKIHAADALITHIDDATHHLHHIESSMEYKVGIDAFMLSQKEGTKPNLRHQRVYNALTYPICKPFNPAFMSLGYYDLLPPYLHVQVRASNAIC